MSFFSRNAALFLKLRKPHAVHDAFLRFRAMCGFDGYQTDCTADKFRRRVLNMDDSGIRRLGMRLVFLGIDLEVFSMASCLGQTRSTRMSLPKVSGRILRNAGSQPLCITFGIEHKPIAILCMLRKLTYLAIALLFAGNSSQTMGGTINNWVVWDAQANNSQLLTKSNGGTIVQNGNTITVGWETQKGLANANVFSGTTIPGEDWMNWFGTTFFGVGNTPIGTLRIGFDTDNDENNNTLGSLSITNLQKITFSSPITNPLLYFAYVQKDAVYDLSGYVGATLVDSYDVDFTNGLLSTTYANDIPHQSAIISLPGTFSEISFNINASNYSFQHAVSNITVAAPVNATNAAVPEPTSMAIFGLGALGVAYRARRKPKA